MLRATDLTARSLRQALLDPVLLEGLPTEDRFAVEGERLLIPPSITWVTPPDEKPDLDVSTPIRSKLEQAQRLEFGDLDVVAAQKVLAEVYTDPSLSPREKGWVGITMAWQAHRAKDFDARDALLEHLDVPIKDPYRTTVAGVILLDAVSGRTLAPWAVDAFVLLSEARAEGVLQRLRDHGRTAEADALSLSYRPVARQRRVLRLAGKRLAALLAVGGPSFAVVDAQVVLFYPDDALAGRGAVLKADQVIGLLDTVLAASVAASSSALDSPTHSASLVKGTRGGGADDGSRPDNWYPVVEGLVGVVPEFPEVEKSGALGLWSAMIALALCFGVGMFMTVRVMRREAEAMRARADFLTSVTHELKTPLASLRLLSERLVDGRVHEGKLEKYYGLIASESSRLTVLIENVLDLGRMERGERSYDKRVQPLGEVVLEAADLFAPLAQSDGFDFVVEVDDELVSADVDRSSIVQALVNVLENARKYARDGKQVELCFSMVDGLARIEVRDHGPGVPEIERVRIFDQFERGIRQKDGSVPGVGLGLYLARSIMRAHGGDLTCCAPPEGEGAVFQFTIPIQSKV